MLQKTITALPHVETCTCADCQANREWPYAHEIGSRMVAIPQNLETQAQAARIIFERIAAGEDVSGEQRQSLINFLSN